MGLFLVLLPHPLLLISGKLKEHLEDSIPFTAFVPPLYCFRQWLGFCDAIVLCFQEGMGQAPSLGVQQPAFHSAPVLLEWCT